MWGLIFKLRIPLYMNLYGWTKIIPAAYFQTYRSGGFDTRSLTLILQTALGRTVATDRERTCLWYHAAASAQPLLLSSNLQRMTGAWMTLYSPRSYQSWLSRGQNLLSHSPECCPQTCHCIWWNLSLLYLRTVRDFHFLSNEKTYIEQLQHMMKLQDDQC